MRQLREWASSAWNLVRASRDDADLEAELRAHLALAADDGAVAGGVAQAIDALRDQRGVPWLDDLRRDIRDGVRMLWRDRALSMTNGSRPLRRARRSARRPARRRLGLAG